jgi:hypothetical protein
VTLTATVVAADAAAVTLSWACVALAGTPPVALAEAALTPTTAEVLVLAPDTLAPGGRYRFTVTARDPASPPGGVSAYVDMEVNEPPAGGAAVVAPREGFSLETRFDLRTVNWVDADAPLWYKFTYEVVGSGEAGSLTEFSPAAEARGVRMPAAGLPAFGYAVRVTAVVRDAFGSLANASTTVAVRTRAMDAAAEEQFVDDLLAENEAALRNGDPESVLAATAGLAALLNRPVAAQVRLHCAGGAPTCRWLRGYCTLSWAEGILGLGVRLFHVQR